MEGAAQERETGLEDAERSRDFLHVRPRGTPYHRRTPRKQEQADRTEFRITVTLRGRHDVLRAQRGTRGRQRENQGSDGLVRGKVPPAQGGAPGLRKKGSRGH